MDDAANDNSIDISSGSMQEDAEDVILQRLHRNAQGGPINPVKEHEKMMKENNDEALNITSADTTTTSSSIDKNLFNSSFYRQLMGSYVDPEFDITRSYDEDYLDDQFYELLSRSGDDLKKLGPGITSAPLDPLSEEARVEKDLEGKESKLQRMTKQIESKGEGEWAIEKIEEAQQLKAEIDRMHIDDCGAVLLANLAFYEAFSARDADWMKEVWWNSPSIVCVHPSHSPLIGSKAVLGSFKNIFEREMLGRESRGGGTVSAPNVFMSPANIRALSVRGTTASLVCDEEIFDKGTDINGFSGRFIVNKLLTSNVFRKVGGRWKLVHRHASWHPETLAANAGLKSKPGFVPVKSERELFNEKLTKKRTFNNELENKRMRIRKLKGGGTSIRPADINSAPASLDGLNANNVVGIPEEKVVKPKKTKSSQDELLKLLGMSSDDDDDEEDEEDDEDDDDEDTEDSPKKRGRLSLSDLLSAGGKGKTTTTGSGTPEDPFVTRRIIRIGPEQFNKLADMGGEKETDEDDEEEEEEEQGEEEQSVVIDLRDKSEEERKKILSNIFPDQVDELLQAVKASENEGKKGGALKSAKPEREVLSVPFKPSPLIQPKETQSATQKCIGAIRELSDQGQLSSNQKRVLLTDIIACSARGEVSMVEVAYELLLSDDSEPGMEDFTEQCRVFASASMDDDELRME
jgi:hypothetical protein